MDLSNALQELEAQLTTRAFLYEDPSSYLEGVQAALSAARDMLERAFVAA